MKDRVEQKYFFFHWKPGIKNMGDYFTKHHPPYHHREVCATYLYMGNSLLKTDHKIVHKWSNAVLMPIHTVSITPNCTVSQGCTNVVCAYRHTNTTTVT